MVLENCATSPFNSTVFTSIACNAGHFLGGSDLAGLILGLITIFILMVSMAIIFIALRIELKGPFMILPGIAGVAFVVGIGWWAPWTAILIVLVCVLLIIRPLMSGGGGGGGQSGGG